MNSKTTKFLRRCADLRFREIVADGKENRPEPYTPEQEAKIQNRVLGQLKGIWNRTPVTQRGRRRHKLETEFQNY